MPAGFTNDYKARLMATIGLQPLRRMPVCRKSRQRQTDHLEAIMKALFFSMALAAGLALWGAEPQAGVDHLMAASRVAGEQVYNIFR